MTMIKKTNILRHLWLLVFPLFMLTACSESDNEQEEFPDWKAKNERAFNTIYNSAVEQQKAGNKTWKVFNVYSKSESVATAPEDHIVVRVLNEGTGSGSPLYTDTVSIHYRGKLLASTSYADGYIFDSSWDGEYNLSTMKPFQKRPVSYFVDGFATALQHMNIGDRWEVYIPYQLGYGKSGTTSSSIPGYSMLIFDLTLVGYSRVGTTVPDWK